MTSLPLLYRPVRIVAAVLVGLALVATPASADISIDFDDFITGPVGSLRTLTEVDVPAELVGQTCLISVLAENQVSVHPGNDLVITTGDTETVISDVEDEADEALNESYPVVVGATILVQLRFGTDGQSSLGFGLTFDCEESVVQAALDGQVTTTEPPVPVETTASTTPTTSPVTVPSSTTQVGGQVAQDPCRVDDGSADGGVAESTTTTIVGSTAADGGAAAAETDCPTSGTDSSAPVTETTVTTVATTTTIVSSSSAAVDPGADALAQTPVAAPVVAAPAYAG